MGIATIGELGLQSPLPLRKAAACIYLSATLPLGGAVEIRSTQSICSDTSSSKSQAAAVLECCLMPAACRPHAADAA